ncbi:hypothetical protein H072_10024 [Dactylellina haptotyla CBS 200.50]|uniref:Dienelactone hydrolase domain-containing protein n=1 Tax=Dactylellina haptotyla (strain CBS 200.50) TaxID=1284197 RepID=S8BBB2_DACHA|nr:hypothetical protein H072_10024 [Dactylellina haptotyla CBS 200.50]
MASEPSQACMCTPPVKLEGYGAEGVYQEIDGLKLYVTGPADPKFAIVFVYDAYGYSDQVFIAADLLSKLTGALCIMPDVLAEGAIPAGTNLSAIPEEDKKMYVGRFRGKVNGFKEIPDQVLTGIKAWKAKWPSVEKWAAFGLCFGAKVVALTSREGTPFVVSGQAHPSSMAPEDPKLISIPHICLASKAEDVAAIENYKATINGESHVETYSDNIHGWMGGRANLLNADEKAAFEKGYKQVATFFGKLDNHSYSGIHWTIIINPSDGPGDKLNSDYNGNLRRLSAAPNVDTVGYVFTDYGRRSIADVEADVAKYAGWGLLNGIFFDETPQGHNQTINDPVAYLTTITNKVRSTNAFRGPESLVIHNPGTPSLNPEVLGLGQNFTIIIEDTLSAYETSVDQQGISTISTNTSRTELGCLIHSVPEDTRFATLLAQLSHSFEHIFLTDRDAAYYNEYGGTWDMFVNSTSLMYS